MSTTEGNVGDLVRRVRGAANALGPKNPQRLLLEECLMALVSLTVQLHEALGEHLPTKKNITIVRSLP